MARPLPTFHGPRCAGPDCITILTLLTDPTWCRRHKPRGDVRNRAQVGQLEEAELRAARTVADMKL